MNTLYLQQHIFIVIPELKKNKINNVVKKNHYERAEWINFWSINNLSTINGRIELKKIIWIQNIRHNTLRHNEWAQKMYLHYVWKYCANEFFVNNFFLLWLRMLKFEYVVSDGFTHICAYLDAFVAFFYWFIEYLLNMTVWRYYANVHIIGIIDVYRRLERCIILMNVYIT